MTTDTITVNEPIEEIENNEASDVVEETTQTEAEPIQEEKVPVSAVIKERRRRQETEKELKWYKEQLQQKTAVAPTPEPDEAQYESVTKAELKQSQGNIIRAVEERSWIKNNPERAEEVNEKLAQFLKQRPNLASAIEAAPNRYEEAWELMNALTQKQKVALKSAPAVKKDAPGSPGSIPKAASLNQAIDVMTMDDAEYNKWRQSVRKKR